MSKITNDGLTQPGTW